MNISVYVFLPKYAGVSRGLCINMNKASKSVALSFLSLCQGFWKACRMVYPLPLPHSDQMSPQAQPTAFGKSRLTSLQSLLDQRREQDLAPCLRVFQTSENCNRPRMVTGTDVVTERTAMSQRVPLLP